MTVDAARRSSHQSLVLINHLARVASRRSTAALAPIGVRPRHLVVLTLLRTHGAVTQSSLGEALDLDPTNLVGLLNELERMSLLSRRRDPADRRRHIVELSDEGAAVLERGERVLADVQDDILAGLDAGERDTLHALLARASEGQAACVACVEVEGACGAALGEAC